MQKLGETTLRMRRLAFLDDDEQHHPKKNPPRCQPSYSPLNFFCYHLVLSKVHLSKEEENVILARSIIVY